MLLGHRKGLAVLVLTEMWERYSFYALRALLVLYLTAKMSEGGLEWSPRDAIHMVGLYLGFAYLTPIIGGYLSDKYLGQRRSAMIGALLMAMGHFCMAINKSLGYGLCRFEYSMVIPLWFNRGNNVNTFSTGGFWESLIAITFDVLLKFQGNFHNFLKIVAYRWIEIKYHVVRFIEMWFPRVHLMYFEACEIGQPRQRSCFSGDHVVFLLFS